MWSCQGNVLGICESAKRKKLYAEDAGIFGGHNMFHNYLKVIADKDIDDVRINFWHFFFS